MTINFDSRDMQKEFQLQLKLQTPKKYVFPLYGYILILALLLTVAFIPYVIVKYMKLKKQYRTEHSVTNRWLTREEKDAEQQYLQSYLTSFLNKDEGEMQRQHTIVRHQGSIGELEKYFTLTGFQTEILSTGTILTTQNNITDFMMDKD